MKDLESGKDLLTGLGKFGLDEKTIEKVFEQAIRKRAKKEDIQKKKEAEPVEEDFLFLKSVSCPVCDHVFSTLMVKSGRVRRMEPDFDLRPRFHYIDTLKYDVTSCGKCGYTALNKDFPHLSPGQVKLIRENVQKNFKVIEEKIMDSAMDYNTAIERYKLALYNSIVKRAHMSERSYECLKISWLYRSKIEELLTVEFNADDVEKKKAIINEILACKKEEKRFYQNAYDGLLAAMSQERYPICGMEQNTYELLLAVMGFSLEQYEDASRLVSGLIVSRTASTNIKNRAYDLKEKIREVLKKDK
uniref:DUF2225 domain-containing protein n=1 Tax=Agathobacter sp. TaxID=2021311 RepID=UPI004055FB83